MYIRVKRIPDCLLSLTALVVIICVASPGPMFFRQKRVAQGKSFHDL